MGLKSSIKSWGSLFFIFLFVFNQVIFFEAISSGNNSQKMNCNINNFSGNPDESFMPNDIVNGNADLLVVDDLVITIDGSREGMHFLDISNPSRPKSLDVSFEPSQYLYELTNFGDIILLGLEHQNLSNSFMKIDLALSSTAYTEIAFWNKWLHGMCLTNDTLYSYLMDFYIGIDEFLIHNATNIDNLTLLGNTNVSGLELPRDFLVHEDFIYFTARYQNLSIYQVNSSYQLSFVQKYVFPSTIESIYFHEDYLFICSNLGFQIYDNSNPASLSLVTHYNISSAQSIRIRNDIAYLTTSDSFTILDLSNIFAPQILDQYIIGDDEYTEMWKIELRDNLAIILTKEMHIFDYPGKFGGYLYIFDVSSPTEIERLYPDRIPLLDNWDKFMLRLILLYIVLPVVTVLSVILIFVREYWKKKQQKKKDSSFET